MRNIQPGMGRFYLLICSTVVVALISGGAGLYEFAAFRPPKPGWARHSAMGGRLMHVMMAAGLAEIPLAVVFKLMNDRRRRRPQQGLCVRCGYDLRGTPRRCPECGDKSVPLSSWP